MAKNRPMLLLARGHGQWRLKNIFSGRTKKSASSLTFVIFKRLIASWF